MNYDELATKIHGINSDKGFWVPNRNEGEMFMLTVSELSEALEEHRDEEMFIYYVHGKECILPGERSGSTCLTCIPKPEGIVIELADCMIRLLDILQMAVRPTGTPISKWVLYVDEDQLVLPENFGSALFQIVKMIAIADGLSDQGRPGPLVFAMLLCGKLIERLGEDPHEVIIMKMTFNETRPFKHGKAY